MSTTTKKKAMNTQLKEFDEKWKNPMKTPFLEKIVLNIGVGAGGEELEKAASVLEQITGKAPIKTQSKVNVKNLILEKDVQ